MKGEKRQRLTTQDTRSLVPCVVHRASSISLVANYQLTIYLIMKSIKIIIAVILLISGQLLFGQETKNSWEKWNYLIGEWIGEGSGQPGQNEGSFSFQTDLDGKILVRKSRTIFPATAGSPLKVHDDIIIVYQVNPGAAQEAIYFDNEGHTIKYKVSFTENSVVLTSNEVANMIRFRFTYITVDNKTVNTTFETASPQSPEEFKMYLSGKAFKIK